MSKKTLVHVLSEALGTEAGQDFMIVHSRRMLDRRSLFENRKLWEEMWRPGQDWAPSGERVMKLLVDAMVIRKRRGDHLSLPHDSWPASPVEWRRGFYRKDKAWYASPLSEKMPCLYIGKYRGSCCDGEFRIQQTPLGLRLEAYDDAWGVMRRDFADLLGFMAESGYSLTADGLQAWMVGAGIKDMTQYSAPEDGCPSA